MMAEKNRVFVIGYDLCEEFTQISYFYSPMEEPESVRTTLNEKKFLIPTETIKKEGIWLPDKKFLEKTLKMIPGYRSLIEVTGLMVSLEVCSKDQMDYIAEAFVDLGISREKLSFQSHSESCIYYALSQKKEFIVNDIAFFEFTSQSFIFRLLQIRKEGKQPLVQMIEKDFSDVFFMDKLKEEEGRQATDKVFLEVIHKEFERKNIGVVYLIGEGFYQEEWAIESLKFLCNHRRVFKGSNLYTKGAAYAAFDHYTNRMFEDYYLICSGRIPWNISLNVLHKEEPKQVILAKAGSRWHEIEYQVECILDDIQTLEIVIASVLTKEKRVEEMALRELPYRPNRMTRILIEAKFLGEDRILLKVKDLGFGDIIIGSGVTIKTEIFL